MTPDELISLISSNTYSKEQLGNKLHTYLKKRMGKIANQPEVDELFKWYKALPIEFLDHVRINHFVEYFGQLQLHSQVREANALFDTHKIQRSIKTYMHMFNYFATIDKPEPEDLETVRNYLRLVESSFTETFIAMELYNEYNEPLLQSLVGAYLMVGVSTQAITHYDTVLMKDGLINVRRFNPKTIAQLFHLSLLEGNEPRATQIINSYCLGRPLDFLREELDLISQVDTDVRTVETFNHIVGTVYQMPNLSPHDRSSFIIDYANWVGVDKSMLFRIYDQWSRGEHKFPTHKLLLKARSTGNTSIASVFFAMIVEKKTTIPIGSTQLLLQLFTDHDMKEDVERVLNYITAYDSPLLMYDAAQLVVYNDSVGNTKLLGMLEEHLTLLTPFGMDLKSNHIIEVFLHFDLYHRSLDWLSRRLLRLHLPMHNHTTSLFEIYHTHQEKKLRAKLSTLEPNSPDHALTKRELDWQTRLAQYWGTSGLGVNSVPMARRYEKYQDKRAISHKSHIHQMLTGNEMPSKPTDPNDTRLRDIINNDKTSYQSIIEHLDKHYKDGHLPAGDLLIRAHLTLVQRMPPFDYLGYRNRLPRNVRALTMFARPYHAAILSDFNKAFAYLQKEEFLLVYHTRRIWESLIEGMITTGRTKEAQSIFYNMIDDKKMVPSIALRNKLALHLLECGQHAEALQRPGLYDQSNEYLNCQLANLIHTGQLDEAETLLATMDKRPHHTLVNGIHLLSKKYGVEQGAERIHQMFSKVHAHRIKFNLPFMRWLTVAGTKELLRKYVEKDPELLQKNTDERYINELVAANRAARQESVDNDKLIQELFSLKPGNNGPVLGDQTSRSKRITENNLTFIRRYFQPQIESKN
ncbi:hypothetical protein SAMD00019534_102430 [Acytostelium subglobosum LB1]|uniref:hypothetical protein n=1 Tax=Acytostelium subglobosum LB1 TaxID=1410327 RepID=UPI00064483BD|nr:hypothetical protein SAMD00019534_102430 [Acytostelium subglobosum LB1]GAM27068.1 hypothetical protein SAMD00019534_102430 [Acytostelium subglobosum LB1]|eukprot:XP_012749948.1 hypothetical protein SAMD00019534_102430 [Acytostelium subglobosum LB1]